MDDPLLDETPAVRLARWFQPNPAELTGLAVLLVGALLAGALLWFQATQRPTTPVGEAGAVGATVDARGTTHGPAPGAPVPASASEHPADLPEQVVVHVTGGVLQPGLVVLEGGDRVADAVAAAGGLSADAEPERINLARPLADGEHLHVPRVGEATTPPTAAGGVGTSGGGMASGMTADGRVDINRADAVALESLPGIGPARAEAIIAHRDEQGRFTVPGDLRGVPGIGEATFQRLAPLIVVG